MSSYHAVYDKKFTDNLKRYASLRKQLKRRVERILANPYHNTEKLDDKSKHLNLLGCRSARLGRNFRIIFVICEECRQVPECEYCFCEEEWLDETIVFLTFGPHDNAYAMR